jgi:multicomponent Na+:H+ antiporter subunit B
VTVLIDIALLSLLVALALGVARLVNLFGAVMLFGIFSLLSAAVFVVLDAVDVAFTEAAVGAGVSTILMLATLALTDSRQRPPRGRALAPLAAAAATGLLLLYGTSDLPPVGDASASAHGHVAPRYIEASPIEVGVPNMVTAVLASYRGYDTLGEVTVIFTAGVAVLSLLGGGRGGDDD